MKHNGFTTFTVKILLFINSANVCAKKNNVFLWAKRYCCLVKVERSSVQYDIDRFDQNCQLFIKFLTVPILPGH